MTKKERISKMLNEGASYNEISENIGVSKSYISQVKREINSHENKKNEPETLEITRDTTETYDFTREYNTNNDSHIEEKKETESVNLRRSTIIYNIENPQAIQRQESDENLVLDLTQKEENEDESETFEEVDEEMLKHEFLGIYESVNLFLDNFDFYQSKEIKKGKLDAIVKNFKAAYPGRHFMSSKILFFTLVISVFASNIKVDKIKNNKLFKKFRKNG